MRFRAKGFTSLLLACTFLVVAVSGVILFMTPRGRVANWTGWTMAGLDKHEWAALHINTCLVFLAVALGHLLLNWRLFWSYIRSGPTRVNLKAEMLCRHSGHGSPWLPGLSTICRPFFRGCPEWRHQGLLGPDDDGGTGSARRRVHLRKPRRDGRAVCRRSGFCSPQGGLRHSQSSSNACLVVGFQRDRAKRHLFRSGEALPRDGEEHS